MRNLWLLLQRNAFLFAFIALMAVSLSVLFRHNGTARSSWFSRTGAVTSTVESNRSRWSNYLHLAEQNADLARENADLRARLLTMEMSTRWEEDSLRGWSVRRGFLVKGPDGKPNTLCLATPGMDGGITPGMGVISDGAAFGAVDEVGSTHSRILTLLHGGATWSCRIGRNGPVASLGWDGRSIDRLQLQDVPRHVQTGEGDSIFTSGYDLRFPADVLMGQVVETRRTSGADFIEVSVRPAVDFRSARYIEFIQHLADSERVVLSQSEPLP